MTEPVPNQQIDPPQSDPPEDVQNDEIIGAAVRTSLIVLMLMGLPVIGGLIYLNLTRVKPETIQSELTAPTTRRVGLIKPPSIPLTEISASESGIDFVHNAGKNGDKLLPETMGSGIAVWDQNGDGNLDLLLVNSKAWPWDLEETPNHDVVTDQVNNASDSRSRLYLGDGEFHFRDATADVGLANDIYGMGVAVGDYDNDGDSDLFLSAVGTNVLYRNDGNRLTDVTSAAGVAGREQDWSTSCGFFDYDNDGKLDLYVCNYVRWSRQEDLTQRFTLDGETRAYGPPRAFAGSFGYLYHNEGDGVFRDVSASSGIQILNKDTGVPLGKSMGVSFTDYNVDGFMDIVVSNDTVQNFLFENQRDGTFREMAAVTGIAFDRTTGNARGAMGIDSIRFRDSESLAIGIGNFANEASALYMSRAGSQQFIDAAMYTGFGPPSRSALTFGLFFWDADLDGRYDILGANGHLEEEIAATQSSQTYAQPPQMFWNAGRDAGSELMMVAEDCVGDEFCEPSVGRGAAYGDFDNDGDQDVIITNNDSRPRLFRNDQQLSHHFLRINAVGSSCNRDAIGAVVRVQAGQAEWTQTVMPTKSYLSQCERTLTFGLGDAATIDSIAVTWPGGETESFGVSEIDRTVRFVQGKSEGDSDGVQVAELIDPLSLE